MKRLAFSVLATMMFFSIGSGNAFAKESQAPTNKTSTSLTTTSSTNSSYIRATVQWNSISNAYLYDVNVRNLTDGYLYQAYQFSASTTSFTTAHLEEGKMFEISVYARDKERQNQIAKGKAIFTSHEGLNFTNINISLQ
ncbi:hypothetical protein P4V47_03775 [Brevibacillus laterosporus]|uniref:hypothetical protein n=1 Tax=Brevibacillus laterosporus TaxID=1465 RepID=UPI0018CEF562|nr:hypothetical protein [Brevibacillus laterosporus]MBG9790535.1 hypothetical protein [Brevibacillus laterosporus]MED1786628.1 hypothetical protein [Brevibacillus laterosporus]